jgi:hypothetical protein
MLEFLENIDASFAKASRSSSKGQCGCADYITSAYPNRDPALNNRLKNDGSWHQRNINESSMKSEKEIGLTVPEG